MPCSDLAVSATSIPMQGRSRTKVGGWRNTELPHHRDSRNEVNGLKHLAAAYHPSTLKTMCTMTASRCTSCEQGHASIALTASTVCLLRSMTTGTVGRRRRSSPPLVPEVVQKVEGWGNSCLITPSACARQLQCESVMTWSPPGLTRLVGLLAGNSEEGAILMELPSPERFSLSSAPGERAKLDEMPSLLLLPKSSASLRIVGVGSLGREKRHKRRPKVVRLMTVRPQQTQG